MPTVAGSGRSVKPETRAAAAEAVRTAVESLGGAPPSFGILFASPKHDLASALAEAERVAPGAAFFGCSTAGEITERGLTRGNLAAMVVSSDETAVQLSVTEGVKANPAEAARRLCGDFAAQAKSASAKGLSMSTSVLLVDGLNGAGECLVNEVLSATRSFQQVVGGAAGDDGAFAARRSAAAAGTTDSAAILHTFSRSRGRGRGHG